MGEASDLQSDDEVFEENSDDSVLYHTGALVPRPHPWRPNTVVVKPDSVLYYNNAKKGVDISDQMASYYTSLRKTLKWYRKLIIEIVCSTMLVNAWVIHQKFGAGKKLSILEFREQIIKEMISKPSTDNQPDDAAEEGGPHAQRKPKHKLEKTEGKLRDTRKSCRPCYDHFTTTESAAMARKKSKRVNTFCSACEKPMCLDCFNTIHTK